MSSARAWQHCPCMSCLRPKRAVERDRPCHHSENKVPVRPELTMHRHLIVPVANFVRQQPRNTSLRFDLKLAIQNDMQTPASRMRTSQSGNRFPTMGFCMKYHFCMKEDFCMKYDCCMKDHFHMKVRLCMKYHFCIKYDSRDARRNRLMDGRSFNHCEEYQEMRPCEEQEVIQPTY
jgi:hypothetical protein